MKKLLCLVLVLILALSLMACGGKDEPAPAANGEAPGSQVEVKDTLSVILSADPGSLDPHDTVGNTHHQATRQIYETLLVRDENGELAPWLAESWEYEDDVTLVLHIRQGVKFHTGDELKASDVVFTLNRMRDTNASIQVQTVDFDKTAAVDDYTVKIVTVEPSPMLLAQLENPLSSILCERVYTENNGQFTDDAACIGTGPYKVVKYDSGDRLTLTAFEDYWREGEPKIANVVMRFITDASSRAIEAESGSSDVVYDISTNDVARVGAAENVNLVRQLSTLTHYFTLNAGVEPLDDLRVRQAIFYAIDLDQIIAVAYGDFGAKGTSIVPPSVEGYVDVSAKFDNRDLEKSKALLAEAGYPDGFSLEVVCPNTDQMRMDSCECLQSQLAEVGIDVVLNYKEYNGWISDMTSGKVAMGVYGFTASTGEAGRNIMRFLPEYSESKIFGWQDDAYIALAREALSTIDADKRNELYAECQEYLMDACIVYPIWHKEMNVALQKDVKGFAMQPSYEQHYLQTVHFE